MPLLSGVCVALADVLTQASDRGGNNEIDIRDVLPPLSHNSLKNRRNARKAHSRMSSLSAKVHHLPTCHQGGKNRGVKWRVFKSSSQSVSTVGLKSARLVTATATGLTKRGKHTPLRCMPVKGAAGGIF